MDEGTIVPVVRYLGSTNIRIWLGTLQPTSDLGPKILTTFLLCLSGFDFTASARQMYCKWKAMHLMNWFRANIIFTEHHDFNTIVLHLFQAYWQVWMNAIQILQFVSSCNGIKLIIWKGSCLFYSWIVFGISIWFFVSKEKLATEGVYRIPIDIWIFESGK